MFKDRLQLVDHVHIAYENDEVVYKCDYHHNIVVSLQNMQLVIRMAHRKTFVHKEYGNVVIPCPQGLFQTIK